MSAEAAEKARVSVTEGEAGRILVAGELTFTTAREARLVGHKVLEGSSASSFIIDCGGVVRADSAGLAVLLDWIAWGRRRSRSVRFEKLPASLVAIARISEVDGLLTATA